MFIRQKRISFAGQRIFIADATQGCRTFFGGLYTRQLDRLITGDALAFHNGALMGDTMLCIAGSKVRPRKDRQT